MPKTLDRKRKFATSYGETNMRYYQDGVYFDAAGNEVETPPVDTPKDPPPGAGARAGHVPKGATAAEVRSDGLPAAPVLPPAASTEPDPNPPPFTDAGEAPAELPVDAATLREDLKRLNFAQVKKLFMAAKGPAELARGAGSVGRMIDWLVENRDRAA
jgi:hypothetical protein